MTTADGRPCGKKLVTRQLFLGSVGFFTYLSSMRNFHWCCAELARAPTCLNFCIVCQTKLFSSHHFWKSRWCSVGIFIWKKYKELIWGRQTKFALVFIKFHTLSSVRLLFGFVSQALFGGIFGHCWKENCVNLLDVWRRRESKSLDSLKKWQGFIIYSEFLSKVFRCLSQ